GVAAPANHPFPGLIAELGGQQAVLGLNDLIPPPGGVKAADQVAATVGAERVLELVAIAPLFDRRDDRLRRGLAELADPLQRVAALRLLDLELALIRKDLPRRPRMRGAGLNPFGTGLKELDRAGFGVGAL